MTILPTKLVMLVLMKLETMLRKFLVAIIVMVALRMKKLKLITYLLILTSLAWPLGQTFASQDNGVYTYIFHLYFDNSKLVPDRDFKFSFDLIAGPYKRPSPEVMTGYSLELISVQGAKLFTVKFTPPSSRGKLTLQAQYFANAKTANFYNTQKQLLLAIDLAPSGPVCNDNGSCQAEVGENNKNCPSDCLVVAVSLTPEPSVVVTPTPSGPSSGYSLLTYILVILILLILTVAGWFFWRWRKNRVAQP